MGRILVIEDEPEFAAFIGSILETLGHTAVVAPDGRAGIAHLQTEVFDALITELVVPEKDGLEVILAARRTLLAIPILAIAGGTVNAELYRMIARKLGANETLEKPFSPSQLTAVVKRMLG